MSTNLKQSKFLDLLDLRTRNLGTFERALYLLLRDEEENIYIPDDNPASFHKSFKQIDVTKSGKRDAAIWILLNQSTIIWEVMDEVYP